MKYCYRKLTYIVFIILATFISLTGMSSLEYARKVDPLANMPEGNPDPNLGIVIHGESTGVDVLADSSKNIRFSASKNFDKTGIELLTSSSMVDRTPKKFKFIDEKYGFSSDRTFEFSIYFSDTNLQWKSIRFMPFPSVIEWVTDAYKAIIRVSLRDNEDYKYYVTKAERKNIKISPDGYIVFIDIIKKSQYPHYDTIKK